jgi:hypothetical protein
VKQSILKRYPELKEDDITLRDDGNGIFISYWNSEKPKPTITQVNQWVAEDEAEPKPKTEIDILKDQNADLNLQIIDLWETLLGSGVVQ